MSVDTRRYTRNNIDCGNIIWMGDEEYRAMMNRISELKRQSVASRDVVNMFENQIRRLIEDNKRMKQYIRNTERSIEQERKRIIQETERQYLRYSNQINHLEESLKQANEDLDRIQDQIAQENKLRLQHKELAHKYYAEAVDEFNAICNDPYFIKFKTPELDRIRHQFSTMEKDDIADDTISGLAIQILGDIEMLKIQVAREKGKFEVEYLKALDCLNKLEAVIKTFRNELFFDDERQNKVDLDFWTGGRFEKLEQSVEHMHCHLERDRMADNYLIPEIKEDLATLNRLDKTTDQLVEEAYKLSDMSEMVEWMAELACQTLAQNFWYVVVNRGFENDDPRGIYVVQARNYDNDSLLELFFSRHEDVISYTYRINIGTYTDGRLMKAFLRDFSTQIPNATLDLKEEIDHVDSELTFHRDQSKIEIPDSVKERFGLA